jgi:hypothetical protein
MIDQPTGYERRWWQCFAKVIALMPSTVEVLVHSGGSLTLHTRGAQLAELNISGNADNVPQLAIDPIYASSILPNGEDV